MYSYYIYTKLSLSHVLRSVYPSHTHTLTPPHVYTNLQRDTHAHICLSFHDCGRAAAQGCTRKTAANCNSLNTATYCNTLNRHCKKFERPKAVGARGLKRLGQEAMEVKGAKTRLKIQMHLFVAHCALKRLLCICIMICHEL